MLLETALYVALSCPTVVTENRTEEPWTSRDDRELQAVVDGARCVVHYPSKPCAGKFIKLEPLRYHVVCVPFAVEVE